MIIIVIVVIVLVFFYIIIKILENYIIVMDDLVPSFDKEQTRRIIP